MGPMKKFYFTYHDNLLVVLCSYYLPICFFSICVDHLLINFFFFTFAEHYILNNCEFFHPTIPNIRPTLKHTNMHFHWQKMLQYDCICLELIIQSSFKYGCMPEFQNLNIYV